MWFSSSPPSDQNELESLCIILKSTIVLVGNGPTVHYNLSVGRYVSATRLKTSYQYLFESEVLLEIMSWSLSRLLGNVESWLLWWKRKRMGIWHPFYFCKHWACYSRFTYDDFCSLVLVDVVDFFGWLIPMNIAFLLVHEKISRS